jgi:hypothetical protein
MFVGGGSTWDGPDGTYWSAYPNAPGDLWAYDPSAKRWDYHGSSLVDRTRPTTSALAFDPRRGTILTLSSKRTREYDPNKVTYSYSDTPTTVWEYDPASGRWTDHAVALRGPLSYFLMAVDTSRDALVVLAWDARREPVVLDYELAKRTWITRQPQGDMPPKPFGEYVREGDKVVFSTRTGRLLYVSAVNDGALYALETSTWTWSQVLPFGAFPQIHQAFATCWCPIREEMYLAYKLTKAQSIDVFAVKA